MHRSLFILVYYIVFILSLTAQGIKFFEGTWEEVLDKGKKRKQADIC